MKAFLNGALFALIFCAGSAYARPETNLSLPLSQAIAIAIERDPWFSASKQAQQAQALREHAVASRPVPSVSLSMANLPVDTFSVHQEPMTQVRIGVAQTLSRGESVALSREQQRLKAQRYPLEREERAARVALAVTRLYIEHAQAAQHIKLVNANITIFEQLLETTASAYQSGVGQVRQQDVLDARLALVKLKEQRASVYQRKDKAVATLSALLERPATDISIAPALPEVALPEPLLTPAEPARAWLSATLSRHPTARLLAVDHKVARKEVALSRQKNTPQWALNGSYGYRADTRSGESRADFFSVGVTVDVPLFNEQANDSAVKAAFSESESIETRRRAQIRDLMTEVLGERAALHRLYERKAMYDKDILTQSRDYAEATLDAYTAAQGAIETVLDARTAHLQAEISVLNLRADIARSRAMLAYLITQTGKE